MMKRQAAALAAALYVCGCSGAPSAPSAVPNQGSSPSPTSVGVSEARLIGAGDIATCDSPGSELTARLLDVMGGTVFTTGDNAYPSGSYAQFRDCYNPSWGRHRDRTRPTPGNHDYEMANAAAYYDYFGSNAGPAGLGYYSYPAGEWHVVALNSEIDVRTGSPQEQWLRADLMSNPASCTAVLWHRPRFSSGPSGDNRDMQDIWRTIQEFNVDIVLNGHDHLYERFAQQDVNGRADSVRGIRQFIIGTGGRAMSPMRAPHANSEVIGGDMGVLALTLLPNSYRWEFVPVAGATFRDSGTALCH
jgi:calcineurin-like phosphoesterase family protein